jgi:hypothetical protein
MGMGCSQASGWNKKKASLLLEKPTEILSLRV